jgi:hypothetical protein
MLGQNLAAQDVDYTSRIINNDFDSVAPGVVFGDTEHYPVFFDGSTSNLNNAWRPVKQNVTKVEHHLEFYGWQLSDWEWMWKNQDGNWLNNDPDNVNYQTTSNHSIGISTKPASGHGLSSAWINAHGNAIMPESFEFYQIIDKDNLPAGTYKVQCLLGHEAGNQFTTQRLFANQNVQFLRAESDYTEANRTPGEIYSYANQTPGGLDVLKEMTVYVTIGEEDALKIGIRSGNLQKSGTGGTTSGNTRGAFKVDYFRLTKIDTDAKLSGLSLPVGVGTLFPAFDPAITEYTATFPSGLPSIAPIAVAGEQFTVTGTEDVDVSSGSGVSTIVVTSKFDETSVKTYTINYTAGNDIYYTDLVLNNSFEYASDGTLLDADADGTVDDSHTGKGKDGNNYRVKNSLEKEFYIWRVTNWDFAGESNTSQGMNRDIVPIEKINGTYATWLGGDLQFKVDGENTNSFEFYQIIDKDLLPAGTYKVQCLLAVEDVKRTSQRLFANNSVQYHGTESQYASNQTEGETAGFAGWGSGDRNLQEMQVYVTIADEDSLKIGIRTGNIKGDGTIADNANPLWGWFKTDYFRLTKIDTDVELSSLSLPVGELSPAFDPETTEYTATLPFGTQSVTPIAAAVENAVITGAEAVDVTSGSGVSTIVVTSVFDETKTKTYTINYTVDVIARPENLYIIGGPFNAHKDNWIFRDIVQLEKDSENPAVFYYRGYIGYNTFGDERGNFKILTNNNSWDGYHPGGASNLIIGAESVGVPSAMRLGGEDTKWEIPDDRSADGYYVLKFDTGNSTFLVESFTAAACPEYPVGLFAVGGPFIVNVGSWDPAESKKLERDNVDPYIFHFRGFLEHTQWPSAESGSFKILINARTWDDAFHPGGTDSDLPLNSALNNPMPVRHGGADNKWTIGTDGTGSGYWDFSINIDPAVMTITVNGFVPELDYLDHIYISGSAMPSGWTSYEVMNKVSSGVYEWTGDVNVGQFKFLKFPGKWEGCYVAANEDEPVDFIAGNSVIYEQDYTKIADPRDLKFVFEEAATDIKLTLNLNTYTFQAEKAITNIQNIENEYIRLSSTQGKVLMSGAENTHYTARIFTLDGRMVAQKAFTANADVSLAQGVYVVKINGQVTKIAVLK